jgi:hypothetical protein
MQFTVKHAAVKLRDGYGKVYARVSAVTLYHEDGAIFATMSFHKVLPKRIAVDLAVRSFRSNNILSPTTKVVAG